MCLIFTKNPFHKEHRSERVVPTQWGDGATGQAQLHYGGKNTSYGDQQKGLNTASLFTSSVTLGKLYEISERCLHLAS